MGSYEAYKVIKKDLFLTLAVGASMIAIMSGLYSASDFGRDSTDGEKRSGMRLHTDALTGCQYLSVPGAGLTPRLDSEAFPICAGGKQ